MTLIYVIAGEASGDVLGARLIAALRARRPDLEFAGIGGERMAEQGVPSLFPFRELALMGLLEVLPNIRRLARRLNETVADIAAKLRPSARGELEIIDVQKQYQAWGELEVIKMGRGLAWLDTGTHDSLVEAAQFIQTIERRQGLKISCPEEIAWRMGYISAAQLEALARPLAKSGYGEYLLRCLSENPFREG